MKRLFLLVLIVFIWIWPAKTQNLLKDQSDTLFLLEFVFFPQVQLNMAIAFENADFKLTSSIAPKLSKIDSLKIVLKKNPNDAAGWLALSNTYSYFGMDTLESRALDTAREAYMRKFKASPSDTSLIRNLAYIYIRQGEVNLAGAYFEELTRMYPDDPYAWSGLAAAYGMVYDVQGGIECMDKAIALKDDDMDFYGQLASLLSIKAVMDMNITADSLLDSYTFSDFFDFSKIDAALMKYPGNEQLLIVKNGLVISAILLEAVWKNPAKFAAYSDSVKFVLPEQTLTALDDVAKFMLKAGRGKYKEKKFPWVCLMFSELLRNNDEQARKYFDEGIQLVGDKAKIELYNTIVGIYAIAGNKAEALKIQLELNKIEPTDANFVVTAYIYFTLGDFSSSKEYTRKALNINSYNFLAQLGMASVLLKEKKAPESAPYLAAAAAINAQSYEVQFLQSLGYIFENRSLLAKRILDELIAQGINTNECTEVRDHFFPR